MNTAVRIIQIKERDTHHLSHRDLWDKEGRSKVRSEARQLNALSIFESAQGVQIRLNGLVGYLPITDSIVLDIRPRFPVGQLWDMLAVAGDDFVRMVDTERGYRIGEQTAPPLVLARAFCKYLKSALNVGLDRAYRKEVEEGYFRPKLDVGSTIKRYGSRGDPVTVVSNVDRFTYDTEQNSILKAACRDFSQFIPKTQAWSEEKRIVFDALQTLSAVQDRQITPSDLSKSYSVNSRVAEHYKGIFTTYKLLRTGGGFAFDVDPKGNHLPSFFFKLDDVLNDSFATVFEKV